MITAAVSAILGILGGAIPELLKEFTTSREFAREMAMLDKQYELEEKKLKIKQEIAAQNFDMQQIVEQMKSMKAAISAGAKRVGVPWIDGFNALQRPFAVFTAWLLFLLIAGMFTYGVMSLMLADENGIQPQIAANLLWNSMIGEVIQAVVGYLFGYRSSVKASKALRGG